MEGTVQLIFAGEVLEGFSPAEVRRRVGELFKLEEARLAAMFSGSQVVIKRGLSPDLAKHWVAQFQAMGARLHVQQVMAPAPGLASPATAATARDPLAPMPAPIVVNTLPPTEEITCPNCAERQPKRILCRSCTTDMPRAIAAREEEAAAERARRREEALARRGVRTAAAPSTRHFSASMVASDDAPLFGLSFGGRISRMRNFLGGLLAMTFGVWLLILVGIAPGPITGALLVIGFAFAVVWGCRLTALRLHDTGRSAWWLLVLFVPYLGGIASLALSLWPSDDGENEYGPEPVTDDSIPAVGTLVVLCLSIALGWSMVSSAVQRQFAEFRDAAETEEQAEGEEPALPAAELQRVLHSDAAVGEFQRYMGTPGHRAFAVSSGGGWGWHAGAARPDQAAETALADCERRRPPYTAECRLVHLNDQWTMN